MIEGKPFASVAGLRLPPLSPPQVASESPAGPRTFGSMLSNALLQVDNAQSKADQETLKLVTGEAENLHDVVIATEEAGLMVSLAVQVRNRAVEAYQELMRTQI